MINQLNKKLAFATLAHLFCRGTVGLLVCVWWWRVPMLGRRFNRTALTDSFVDRVGAQMFVAKWRPDNPSGWTDEMKTEKPPQWMACPCPWRCTDPTLSCGGSLNGRQHKNQQQPQSHSHPWIVPEISSSATLRITSVWCSIKSSSWLLVRYAPPADFDGATQLDWHSNWLS